MGVFSKIKGVIERQPFMQKPEDFSTLRIFLFYFSISAFKRYIRFSKRVFRYFYYKISGKKQKSRAEIRYSKWQEKNVPNEKQLEQLENNCKSFDKKPLFSIIMPLYKPNLEYLKEAIHSIDKQIYKNWELCIADDFSQDDIITEYLNTIKVQNSSIKVTFREENGHISACSNSALSLAKGDYVCFMDQDDLLSQDALYWFAYEINNSDPDIIYSDEDKIDSSGEFVSPVFKPSWSPHSILTRNYIGHFVSIKKAIVDKIGGFRLEVEGSQDHDLLLRACEISNEILRIPKILYHWRMHEGSTAFNGNIKNYAFKNGEKALNDALQRRKIKASAKLNENIPGHYKINYNLIGDPKVSIIIPTKDNAEVLSTCLKSIFSKSSYKNFEVILLNNNSTEKSLFDLIEFWKEKEKHRFKALEQSFPFNYSKLMNNGVDNSDGEYILLLNNDTEVLEADWIEKLLSNAQLEEIGAVGAKLYFHDDTLQHGGVVMGLGAVAGHVFVRAEKDCPGYYFNLMSTTNYSAVTAACLMVSKTKYIEVGGFDEKLAIEYNDVDFCLKLIEAGYYNIFNPEVQLYHYESLTRGHPHANSKTYKVHIKEVKYFKSKWEKYIEDDPYYNPNLSKETTFFEIGVNI